MNFIKYVCFLKSGNVVALIFQIILEYGQIVCIIVYNSYIYYIVLQHVRSYSIVSSSVEQNASKMRVDDIVRKFQWYPG